MAPRYSPELALIYDQEKDRKGMLIVQRWPWHESWWLIWWRLIAGSEILCQYED